VLRGFLRRKLFADEELVACGCGYGAGRTTTTGPRFRHRGSVDYCRVDFECDASALSPAAQIESKGFRPGDAFLNCPSCDHENRSAAKFCEECGAHFLLACSNCGTDLRPGAKFCDECGTTTSAKATRASAPAGGERSPSDYTPKHLADRILQSKSALEGERKQVTVLFADVKGSMELAGQGRPGTLARHPEPILRDMDVLERAYEQARSGNGQVVGVVAQSGTGKSRLCFEFVERCRARGLRVLQGTGVAHGKNIPFLPIRRSFANTSGSRSRTQTGWRARRSPVAYC
jgi:hypothetical protein